MYKRQDSARAADENAQTWWKAGSAESGAWLSLDLGEVMDVRAVQINFADDRESGIAWPPQAEAAAERWIDLEQQATRWLLEGSADGETWMTVEDKRDADTDLSHDLVAVSYTHLVELLLHRIPVEQHHREKQRKHNNGQGEQGKAADGPRRPRLFSTFQIEAPFVTVHNILPPGIVFLYVLHAIPFVQNL